MSPPDDHVELRQDLRTLIDTITDLRVAFATFEEWKRGVERDLVPKLERVEARQWKQYASGALGGTGGAGLLLAIAKGLGWI